MPDDSARARILSRRSYFVAAALASAGVAALSASAGAEQEPADDAGPAEDAAAPPSADAAPPPMVCLNYVRLPPGCGCDVPGKG